MQQAVNMFESYNTTIENFYESFLKRKHKERKTNVSAGEVEYQLESVIDRWYHTPLKELGDATPEQYINDISNLDELIEIFKDGARICDELPQLIVTRLKRFGPQAEDELLSIALDKGLFINDEMLNMPLAAIEIMSKWKVEKAIDPFIELLFDLDSEENSELDKELFMDHISVALAGIGVSAENRIIDNISRFEPRGEVFNSLLYALSLLGEDHKSNAIYMCLRSSFMRMEDKIFAAGCLGDYGDARAIPLLRGYVDKNKDSIKKEVYYAIRHEVEALGGNMDDISVEFSD